MPTRIAVTMLALVGTLSLATSTASAHTPIAAHCGDIVSQNVRLADDLTACPADGLVIGADNIAVDLNGHTVSAAGGSSASGILADGHRRVRVFNGKVTGFAIGIFLSGASESRVAGVRLSHNSDIGILLVESHGVTLRNNVVSHGDPAGADTGIQLFQSTRNEIEGNILFALGDGVSLAQSNDNHVERNSSSRNGAGVGVFDGSSRNRIEQNVVNDNSDTGVLLDGHADDNVIAENHASGNAFAGIAVGASDRNRVTRNLASGNPGGGIAIVDAAIGTIVKGNEANGNGIDPPGCTPDCPLLDDGIHVDAPATTVTGNTSNHNADLGIQAMLGVTDGGGNRAHTNGNSLQCTFVLCR
jgi:parallel beta-helix repeat protein